MDSLRYFIALIVLVALPPGLLLWLVIHPFASFWRRLGPVWTYAILAVPVALVMAALFLARGRLLAIEFGTSYVLTAPAVLCLAAGATMFLKRRRQLTAGILTGLPELSQKRYPGRLLTEGLYGRVRHPRYLEITLWTLAYALLANYLAPYVLLALSVPTIYVVVLLEERELHNRFGAEYEAYCRRVPRFVPRIRPRP
jgi:protein-S-isoprenylcysteine O-methyltransferase Ste14